MKRLWVPRDPSCLDSGRTSTHSHHRTGKPGILHILYYIEKNRRLQYPPALLIKTAFLRLPQFERRIGIKIKGGKVVSKILIISPYSNHDSIIRTEDGRWMDKFRPHGISALGKGFLQMAVSGHPAGQDNFLSPVAIRASLHLVTRTSTMASWKEAATSSRLTSRPRCACA